MSRSLLVLLFAALLAQPSQGRAATLSEDYVAGFAGDSDGLCRTDSRNPTGLNIGAVCFPRLSASRMVVTISDASGLDAGGYYIFVDGLGRPVGAAVSFCGKTRTVPIPPGSPALIVYLTGAFGPLVACAESTSSLGVDTNGTVTATLS